MNNVRSKLLFAVAVGLISSILLTACTTKPQGCPLPKFFAGDIVRAYDDVIGKVLSVQVNGCGDITYTLKTDLEDGEGDFLIFDGVPEGRLSPYELDCE